MAVPVAMPGNSKEGQGRDNVDSAIHSIVITGPRSLHDVRTQFRPKNAPVI